MCPGLNENAICRLFLIGLHVFVLQHVTEEGTTLVKQAEDAASNKKVLVKTLGT